MQKRRKTLRCLGMQFCMILLLVLACVRNVDAAVVHRSYTGEELTDILQGVIDWQKEQMGVAQEDSLLDAAAGYGSDLISDWYAIGMSGCGFREETAAYRKELDEKVTAAYRREEKLDGTKATEWHRISLAVLALGGNPQAFGRDPAGNPIDLIADGTYNRGKTISLEEQGLNAYIWALIAMDSQNYPVAADASDTREDIIQKILEYQLPDGGFSMENEPGGQSDPDMTAMALQALAPYADTKDTYPGKETGTGNAVEKTVGQVIAESLEALSSMQQPEGDFVSWKTENAESTAQVLIALCALSIDPLRDERFVKDGMTLLDGLMKYHLEQGGFAHSLDADIIEGDSMASEQAFCAISALCRYYAKRGSLYDFQGRSQEKSLMEHPELIQPEIQITKWDAAAVEELPEALTLEQAEAVKALCHTWEIAENRKEYREQAKQLEVCRQTLEKLEKEVNDLDTALMKLEAEGAGIGDFSQVQRLWKRAKALSDYDRNQITQLDFLKHTRLKLMLIPCAALLLGGAVLVWIVYRTRKRVQPDEDGWES